MKKKLFILSLIPFLAAGFLAGCNTDSGTVDPSGDNPTEAKTEEDVDKYDAWLNSWSKPGHLYFHYNRGDKGGYNNYALWLWPFMPVSLEGTLWAYSSTKTKVSDTLELRPMSNHWMTYEEIGRNDGTGTFRDAYGVIADVDYESDTLVGGKTGKKVSLKDSEWLGFLLPQIDHMDGSTMWVSDGGRETYIEDINNEEYWRDIDNAYGKGKAIHIFVATGALSEYTFFAGSGTPEARTNPIDADETGIYSSTVKPYSNNLGNTSTAQGFKNLGVGYQIFVASFRDSNGDGTGDIRGVINSLDYLSHLGAEVLWLTPIQKSDSYHGYDISDYYAVDKRFGTISDYRELIYKAHEKGMKVVMDLVLNHTSKGNTWFTKSQWNEKSKGPNGEDINWRNIYTWKFESDKIQKYIDGSYQEITVKEDAESKNPSWYRDGESHYYYYGKFGSGMPEINYLNPQTRSLVIDMAKYWMSFGLDGFRLDAVKHIFMTDEAYSTQDIMITDVGQKESYDEEKGQYITKDFDYSSNLTKNIMWWKEFAKGVKDTYPNAFMVGENFDGWGTRTAPYYQALDSQFSFATYYHITTMLYTRSEKSAAGGDVFAYNHPLETSDVFGSTSWNALGNTGISVPGGGRPDYIDGAFTSNHDVMRAINHVNGTFKSMDDSIDNTHITGSATEVGKAKVHAAATLLNQGISWIYYGDELGMSSNTYKHKEMYGSENCEDIWYRQPFLWKDESVRPHYMSGQYVFELDDYNKTLPSMEDQEEQASSMLKVYETLINIKKHYPANATVTYSGSKNVLVIKATGNGKTVCTWINTGLNNDEYIVHPEGMGVSRNNCIGLVGTAPDSTTGQWTNAAYSIISFMAD